MNQEERLQNIARAHKKTRPPKAEQLGPIVGKYIKNKVSRQQAQFAPIADAWCQLVPFEIRQHCELKRIVGGVLEIAVDSPSYLYKMQTHSLAVLKELQQSCGTARLQKVKFISG